MTIGPNERPICHPVCNAASPLGYQQFQIYQQSTIPLVFFIAGTTLVIIGINKNRQK